MLNFSMALKKDKKKHQQSRPFGVFLHTNFFPHEKSIGKPLAV
jgi:hypothetical protein